MLYKAYQRHSNLEFLACKTTEKTGFSCKKKSELFRRLFSVTRCTTTTIDNISYCII